MLLIVLYWTLISLSCTFFINHAPILIAWNNLLKVKSLSTLSHTKGLNIFLSRKWHIILPFLKFFLDFTSDFLGLPSLTFSKRNQLSLLTSTEREMKRSKRMASCRMIYPLQVESSGSLPIHTLLLVQTSKVGLPLYPLKILMTRRRTYLSLVLYHSNSTLILCTIEKKSKQTNKKTSGTCIFQSVTHTTINLF